MQEFLNEISRQAGALAMQFYKRGVSYSTKTNRLDLLTEADVAVSKFLVEAIHAKYPDHHIHSEEMTDDINTGAEYEWVIDPIDGTWNFANHIPIWGVLIAVMRNGATKYAATYFPIDDHLYIAEKGFGVFLIGEKIIVSDYDSLDRSVGHFFVNPERVGGQKLAALWPHLLNNNVRTRNYACMYGAVLVARGVHNFYISNGGVDHDHLAPVLICEEAGAVVTNSFGEPWKRGMKDMVIAGPQLHPKILELFN